MSLFWVWRRCVGGRCFHGLIVTAEGELATLCGFKPRTPRWFLATVHQVIQPGDRCLRCCQELHRMGIDPHLEIRET